MRGKQRESTCHNLVDSLSLPTSNHSTKTITLPPTTALHQRARRPPQLCRMFLKHIDLTTALRPSYLPDEVLLFVQDNVGLYEG